MAKPNVQKPAQPITRRAEYARQSITFELVATLAPSATQAERMSTAFALEPVDYHGIREATEEQVGSSTRTLEANVNETAMRIHLQRVVGAFVGSAHGAAQFYNTKVTQARDLTSKLANDDRDEDSDGVYGFETKAARARAFAGQAGLTAYALLAAAEGAVHAYSAITGEDWKPYEAPLAPAATINRKSASAELDALA
jgi:hypothetical protein